MRASLPFVTRNPPFELTVSTMTVSELSWSLNPREDLVLGLLLHLPVGKGSWVITAAQKTRIKDFEPTDFAFHYDQLVANVDWNGGHLDRITLPIFTCELDEAPGYPDADQATKSECYCT